MYVSCNKITISSTKPALLNRFIKYITLGICHTIHNTKTQSSDNKIGHKPLQVQQVCGFSWAVLCEVGHMVERWGPGLGQCSCGYMPTLMPTQFKTAGATIQTCTPSLWTRCCCLSGGSAYSSAPVNDGKKTVQGDKGIWPAMQ